MTNIEQLMLAMCFGMNFGWMLGGVIIIITDVIKTLKEKHKIKMNILERLPAPVPPQPLEYYITSGHINRWDYFPGSRASTVF